MFYQRARWVTDKYILIMLGLFPLFCGFRLRAYEHITEAKFAFFAAATGLWAAAVLALVIIGAVKKERYPVKIRPAHIAVAAFLAAGAVSALASDYGDVCLIGGDRNDGYLTMVMYGAIFFGVSIFASPRPRYFWAMGISAGICSVIAILQLWGLDPFWLYPEGTNYFDKYVAYNSAFLGTIGNTGILAAYLCLAAPMLTIFGAESPGRWDNLLLLPGALSLCVLVLCDVDAGIVALAGCILVSAPMLLRKKRAAQIAAGVSGGIAAGGLGLLYFWPGSSGTLWEMSRVLHGELLDSFGSSRGEIWKNCWKLFREKPWFGGGPGSISKRIDITWSRYIEELGRERTVRVGNAHNVYMAHLVNLGIFGLLSYLAAFGCSLVTWWRRRGEGVLYPALGSAFLCYMIQDFFGLGLHLTAPMLWVVWGLLESVPEAEGERAEPPIPKGKSVLKLVSDLNSKLKKKIRPKARSERARIKEEFISELERFKLEAKPSAPEAPKPDPQPEKPALPTEQDAPLPADEQEWVQESSEAEPLPVPPPELLADDGLDWILENDNEK